MLTWLVDRGLLLLRLWGGEGGAVEEDEQEEELALRGQ